MAPTKTEQQSTNKKIEEVYKCLLNHFDPSTKRLLKAGHAMNAAMAEYHQAEGKYLSILEDIGKRAKLSTADDVQTIGDTMADMLAKMEQSHSELDEMVTWTTTSLLNPIETNLNGDRETIKGLWSSYMKGQRQIRRNMKQGTKKGANMSSLEGNMGQLQLDGLRRAHREQTARYAFLLHRHCEWLARRAKLAHNFVTWTHGNVPRWQETCPKIEVNDLASHFSVSLSMLDTVSTLELDDQSDTGSYITLDEAGVLRRQTNTAKDDAAEETARTDGDNATLCNNATVVTVGNGTEGARRRATTNGSADTNGSATPTQASLEADTTTLPQPEAISSTNDGIVLLSKKEHIDDAVCKPVQVDDVTNATVVEVDDEDDKEVSVVRQDTIKRRPAAPLRHAHSVGDDTNAETKANEQRASLWQGKNEEFMNRLSMLLMQQRQGDDAEQKQAAKDTSERAHPQAPHALADQQSAERARTTDVAAYATTDTVDSGGAKADIYVSLHMYSASDKNQLTLRPGDHIELIKSGKLGWAYGHSSRTGERGWFPLSFAVRESDYVKNRWTPFDIPIKRKEHGADSAVSLSMTAH